jgi:hypothetical protein
MKTLPRLLQSIAIFALALSAPVAGAAGDPVNGKVLYDANCSGCHGSVPDAIALYAAGPDLTEIKYAIANIPEMRTRPELTALTDAQLSDITAFLATYTTTAPGGVSYQGLWWKAPANSESGWGLNLAHQGDTIFASWFTYDTAGKGWWLVVTMNKTGTGTYGGDLYTTSGARFDAFNPANVTPTKVGTATLTFTDANNGTFNYVIGAVNQTKAITREAFGTIPTCTFGTVADLSTATNYQDLWWNKPANSESGWGINLNHESDTIFATWFTYDTDGTPLWLVVTANKTGTGVYSGDLYRTAGARFDAFNPASVVPTKVGTATFTFADGNNATFDYTVQLAGMAAPVHQQKQITREIFTAPGTTCK